MTVGNVISLRFKELCLREKYKGTIIKEFEREPKFFQFIVDNVVDIERGEPTLTEFCPNVKIIKKQLLLVRCV